MKKALSLMLWALCAVSCSWATYPEPECSRVKLEKAIKFDQVDLPEGTRVERCECKKYEWSIGLHTDGSGVVVPLCDGKPIPHVGIGKKVVVP